MSRRQSRRPRPKPTGGQRRRAHGVVSSTTQPESPVQTSSQGVRLNRWLAERGIASRRKCDELIFGCSVEVNDRMVTKPGYRVQEGDRVSVDGSAVKEVRRLYYLFYKPKSVLCTEDPRETRPRVCDMVEPLVAGRVYAVGRLDEETEGLLLLTNDGDFANLVAHPRHGVTKTYVVLVNGSLTHDEVKKLRDGVWLSDGKAVAQRVRVIRRTRSTTSLEIQLSEGRNRLIRRMIAAVGRNVRSLKRVRIGSLGMTGLRRGQIRPISRKERDDLVALAQWTSR